MIGQTFTGISPGRIWHCAYSYAKFALSRMISPLLSGASMELEMSAHTPRRSRRFGEYELLDKIGQGGMSSVYKARAR